MSKKRLCIIIPMYNSAEFIGRTLDSILESNLSGDFYEIIVVDDGSEDNGGRIVGEYAHTHDNVRLIVQTNGGSSVARNMGLNNTDADYIWFVDSDDKAEHNLRVLVEKLEQYDGTDILDFQYNWINTKGEHVGIGSSHPKVTHDQVIAGRDAILQGYTPGSVCGLLIRKQFLDENGFRFKEGMTHQDVELTYRLFAHAKRVVFFYNIIYNYLFRTGSISKAIIPEKKIKYLSDEVEVVKSFHELAQSLVDSDPQLSDAIKRYADGALFGCVYSMYWNRKRWKPLGINKAILAKLKEYNYYPLHGPFDSWKKRAMSLVLNREFLICK